MDTTLAAVLSSLDSGVGLAVIGAQIEDLLRSFAGQMGRAFAGDVARLDARIASFTQDVKLRQRAEAYLAGIVRRVCPSMGTSQPLS